ncbi:MAG: GFA family protein [Verrucomicrobia bacterium]|nr:MAG: GFA family protein [Verrucomicrobiota bacterium]
MTTSSEGGCLCGNMRYRLRGSVRNGSICYCIDCRRASGAPGVAWVSVRREDFLVLSGQLKQVKHADRLRSFAGCCGTPILIQDADDSEWVDVTTCSMDSPELYSPQAAIWTEDRLSWIPSLSSLVEFRCAREKP